MRIARANPNRSGRVLERSIRAYLFLNRRIWWRLPDSWRGLWLGRAYGRHLHGVVCAYAERQQNHSTFFFRNRPELELMRRVVSRHAADGRLNFTVLACSKGAEVYSMLWAIRSAHPLLKVQTNAVDISDEIVGFAKAGVYSLSSDRTEERVADLDEAEVASTTWRDQPLSIFERLTGEEIASMFEVAGDRASVRPWLKEGITWSTGDASDPVLVRLLGPQDIVVANRFLCHMSPKEAERCLRNIAQLVKPGGLLFVSGVDLDVRSRVARQLGWQPVEDLMREIHEGDVSLQNGWPLEWWGLEPFGHDLPDWHLRYASVFQVGKEA